MARSRKPIADATPKNKVDEASKKEQHDEQAFESKEQETKPESSFVESEYQNHPKFSKFKKGV